MRLAHLEVVEVDRAVILVVELFRIREDEVVFHRGLPARSCKMYCVLPLFSTRRFRVSLRPLEAPLTHEVVVPHLVGRHHEEAEEALRQQHLHLCASHCSFVLSLSLSLPHLLIVARRVSLRVEAAIGRRLSPLVAGRRQLVCRQRDGAGRKAASTQTLATR